MAVLIVLFVLGAALAVYSCKGLIIYWLEVAVSTAAGRLLKCAFEAVPS